MKRLLGLCMAAIALGACASPAATPPAPPPPATVSTPAPTPHEPPPPPKPATLLGGPLFLMAPPAQTLWPGPVSVIVENSPGARPQTGLNDADLVVEALAEAEVTRMLAFYWSRPAAQIGPVRSVRTGFVTIAAAYSAPLAHSGGSADALRMLRSDAHHGRDFDEIYGSGQYFRRSAEREPPHNLYTSTDLLGQAVAERKLAATAVPTTLREPGHAAEPVISRAEVVWHRLHQVVWEWDGQAYRRLDEDGLVHSLASGDPIQTPNLIFLTVEGVNRGPDLGWSLSLERGGKAAVVSAGSRWEGRWSLETGGFALYPDAKVAPLAPGNAWVHLITDESSFKLAP